MEPNRWRQIDDLYHAALERPPDDRAAFLADACADDSGLLREVEELLRHDGAEWSFMQDNALAVAAQALEPNELSQTAPQLFPGQGIGAYKILALLGRGGMGVVYRARDERLRREVAIKVLPASLAHDAERLRRFEQEAHATSALNHPNILTIYDIGAHEGAPFIVAARPAVICCAYSSALRAGSAPDSNCARSSAPSSSSETMNGASSAAQPLGVMGQRCGQNFDRHLAPQPLIARAIDDAHPATPEQRQDFVRSDTLSREQLRGRLTELIRFERLRGDGERVVLHETPLRAVMPQQLFDLTEQAGVISTGIGQKGRALVRRAFQRRVIERFDLLPALLVHLHFKEAPTRRKSDFFLPYLAQNLQVAAFGEPSRTLIVTTRLSRLSRASQNSPTPSAPSGAGMQ